MTEILAQLQTLDHRVIPAILVGAALLGLSVYLASMPLPWKDIDDTE
jgi:hypothetical protein